MSPWNPLFLFPSGSWPIRKHYRGPCLVSRGPSIMRQNNKQMSPSRVWPGSARTEPKPPPLLPDHLNIQTCHCFSTVLLLRDTVPWVSFHIRQISKCTHTELGIHLNLIQFSGCDTREVRPRWRALIGPGWGVYGSCFCFIQVPYL